MGAERAWPAGARGQELYAERGLEQTTGAQIAERAGLTERAFFRHFAGKREAQFASAGIPQESLVKAIAGAPDSVPEPQVPQRCSLVTAVPVRI